MVEISTVCFLNETSLCLQFYDKFNIRHNIAELLEYLWKVPNHQNAWRQFAKEEEKGVYLNFLNFLINDSIYLLDESLGKILELKELEAEMSNTEEWERKPAQERQERTYLFHSQENMIQTDMKMANQDVGLLAFTSEQITVPFLLPEMVCSLFNINCCSIILWSELVSFNRFP